MAVFTWFANKINTIIQVYPARNASCKICASHRVKVNFFFWKRLLLWSLQYRDTPAYKNNKMFPIHHFTWVMSRLAGDMKEFVVLGVYRSTVKKQNKEKTLLWEGKWIMFIYCRLDAPRNEYFGNGCIVVLKWVSWCSKPKQSETAEKC